MKLTKALALIMALAMMFALLAGCGGSGSSASAPAEEPAADTAETAEAAEAPAAEEAGDDVMVFHIGGVGPLTGVAAIYGNAHNNGSQIAVD